MRTIAGLAFVAALIMGQSALGADTQPATPSETATVQIASKRVTLPDGSSVHYLEAGQGSVVVLVHGAVNRAEIWRPAMMNLAKSFRVIAPDMPGYGESDKPPAGYSVIQYAEGLGGFMEALGVPKAALVGNSWGGWVAALAARNYPGKASHLVLVDSVGLMTAARSVSLMPATREEARVLLLACVADDGQVTDERIDDYFEYSKRIRETVSSVLASFREANVPWLSERLKEISTPTLVIWGRQDEMIPVLHGELFAKGIAGSKLTVMENTGHHPQIERPKEFSDAVSQFIGGSVKGVAASEARGEEVTFKASTTWKGEPLTLEGRLFKPEGQGPFPAVVGLPGCAYGPRLYQYTNAWAERLANWGYVCLVVDHLKPRGLKGLELCENLPLVSAKSVRADDAYDAKSYLAQLPFVDGKRIAVIGWSHGGIAALFAAKKKVQNQSDEFRSAVSFYPWCDADLNDVNAPILMLGGDKDGFFPANECSRYVTEATGKSAHEVSLQVYPGAGHVFDWEGMDMIAIGGVRWVHEPKSAADAYVRVKGFLEKHLK